MRVTRAMGCISLNARLRVGHELRVASFWGTGVIIFLYVDLMDNLAKFPSHRKVR